MAVFQEAFKAVEDIHGLIQLSKKAIKPSLMATYYTKLALVFWKSGNHMFHAATLHRLYVLTREQRKNLTSDELAKYDRHLSRLCSGIDTVLGERISQKLACICCFTVISHHAFSLSEYKLSARVFCLCAQVVVTCSLRDAGDPDPGVTQPHRRSDADGRDDTGEEETPVEPAVAQRATHACRPHQGPGECDVTHAALSLEPAITPRAVPT